MRETPRAVDAAGGEGGGAGTTKATGGDKVEAKAERASSTVIGEEPDAAEEGEAVARRE